MPTPVHVSYTAETISSCPHAVQRMGFFLSSTQSMPLRQRGHTGPFGSAIAQMTHRSRLESDIPSPVRRHATDRTGSRSAGLASSAHRTGRSRNRDPCHAAVAKDLRPHLGAAEHLTKDEIHQPNGVVDAEALDGDASRCQATGSFLIDKDEDEGCGRCGKPRSVRFSKERWARSVRPRLRRRPQPAVRGRTKQTGPSWHLTADTVVTTYPRIKGQ